jgi:exopolyphosphatase
MGHSPGSSYIAKKEQNNNENDGQRSRVYSLKMGRWWKRTMLPAFGESGQDHHEERTSLLDPATSTSSSNHQSYDSTEQFPRENHGVAHGFELQQQSSVGCRITDEGHSWMHRTIKHAVICTLIVAAALFVFVADSSLDDMPDFPPAPLLPSAFVDTDATTHAATASLSGLAASMLPSFYADMLPTLSILTETVMPGAVYATRKSMLETRDLLDVFSLVYPNTTSSNATVGLENEDLWGSLRLFLDEGYTLVGEYLDLNHSNVKYSEEQLEQSRNPVLDWHTRFRVFNQDHDVNAFLATPTTDDCFYHENESRLFWKHIPVPNRPHGGDPAMASLQYLASKQLGVSLKYWKRVYPYTSIDATAHEDYHDLRKMLRSLVDEFHLFGSTMFPTLSKTKSAVKTLAKARGLLGDMNDDWTAYMFYLKHNEYLGSQTELANRVNEAWKDFKIWADESGFENSIRYLKEHMEHTQQIIVARNTTTGNRTPLSLEEFLKARKEGPTRHFVMGNEAGDADSIISAITLAYIESVKGHTEKTPIVSIPQADLETQRPETALLLKLAGISNAAGVLLFVDQPIVTESTEATEVTLVDHNRLADTFQQNDWKVVEIVDHHHDQGMYMDTCSGPSRWIAFADDEALAASACTLVVERMEELWRKPYPSSLSVLLLGVILLDSVNLSPQAGKVTQRDRDAVQILLNDTNWQELSQESKEVLKISLSSGPNTTAFFDALQDTKYDPGFWMSLSMRDALRLDYKEYTYTDGSFGVSTVLMPLDSFLLKHEFIAGIHRFMVEQNMNFLGIMLASEKDGHLCRQLVLCGTESFPLPDMAQFLLHSDYDQDSLELMEIEGISIPPDNSGLSFRFFDQRNVKASRKQIGPILLEFFDTASAGD